MASDSFKVIKNVNESFDLYVSNFAVNTALRANSTNSTDMSVIPTFEISPSASSSDGTEFIAQGTTQATGESGYNFYTSSSNCFILKTLPYSFSFPSTSLGIGSSGSNSFRTWIPFIVDLTGPIIIAYVQVRAWEDSSSTTVSVKVGCELSGNPIAPVGVSLPDYYNDLNSRIMTTHVTFNYTVPPLIAQTGYCNFDITASLNEVLALSTWVSGHIVAIIIDDNGSTLGSNRQVYAYQGGVYDPIMVVSA